MLRFSAFIQNILKASVTSVNIMKDFPDDDCMCMDEDCPVCNDRCHYCGGDGFGIIGVDWDSDDAINGPYDGEIEQCPCCSGTGDAKDCVFW